MKVSQFELKGLIMSLFIEESKIHVAHGSSSQFGTTTRSGGQGPKRPMARSGVANRTQSKATTQNRKYWICCLNNDDCRGKGGFGVKKGHDNGGYSEIIY